MAEVVGHLLVVIQEIGLELLEGHGALHIVDTLVEHNLATFVIGSPDTYLTAFHQIAQLQTILLNLFVGTAYLVVVQLCLQVHFAFFRDVSCCHRDIDQSAGIVIDGVNANLQIDVHFTLRYHAVETNPQLLHVVAVQAFVEGRHVKQVDSREKGIGVVAVEIADLAHLGIGV